jgi:tRNA-2-methylthio-N6-dimethylallyladenosine synthase
MTPDFVPADVIRERFARLSETQNRISAERNAEMLGRTVEVLSEGPSRKDPTVATTRTRTGKVVHVGGAHRAGAFFHVRIDSAHQHHLAGSPI